MLIFRGSEQARGSSKCLVHSVDHMDWFYLPTSSSGAVGPKTVTDPLLISELFSAASINCPFPSCSGALCMST